MELWIAPGLGVRMWFTEALRLMPLHSSRGLGFTISADGVRR